MMERTSTSTMAKGMKVLHLRASPFLGSPERLILGRIKKMRPALCEYVVAIFNEQPQGENAFQRSLRNLGVDTVLLSDPITGIASNLARIARMVKKHRVDVICCHDYKSDLHGLIAGRLTDVPVMSVFHGRTRTDRKIRLYQRIDDHILRYMDAVVCVSEQTRLNLAHVLPIGRLHVIPNAVDAEEINRMADVLDAGEAFPGGKPSRTIVFAGRLSKEKGIDCLIQAMRLLLERRKDVQLMILGSGPEEDGIRSIIKETGIENAVHLLGFKENVYPYIKQAELLVLPSLTEGMPVVVLEAMALCKPIVATSVGGIPEVIHDGVEGRLVPQNDAGSLARTIESLLCDPEETGRMGRRGNAAVIANHGFESQVGRYQALYRTL